MSKIKAYIADRRFSGGPVPGTSKNGQSRIYGQWYNFGSNVSWLQRGPNSYRLRLDTTGEIVVPAGPAGRDAIMMALHYGRDDAGYAHFNFGADYKEAAKETA